MTKITIELEGEHSLEVLRRLTTYAPYDGMIPSEDACELWQEELKNKIEAALLKVSENTWKHLTSFNRDGVYAEINEFGKVRVGEKIYKPEFDTDYNWWATKWVDQLGDEHPINPIYFVKIHFDKDLEL